jgi:hypothetical protein
MNKPEPDESLEMLLDEMRPASAPPALLTRIENSLESSAPVIEPGPSVWALLLRRMAVPVGAAVIVALAFILQRDWTSVPQVQQAHQEEPEISPLVYSPVETNSVLLSSEELGIIPGPDEIPVRLMRVRWLDYSRSLAADGSELYLTDTREQIVPVSLTFN